MFKTFENFPQKILHLCDDVILDPQAGHLASVLLNQPGGFPWVTLFTSVKFVSRIYLSESFYLKEHRGEQYKEGLCKQGQL